jgi:hypothetical protein
VPSFYHKHEHLTIKSQVKKRILKNEKRRTTGATIPPIICRKYLNPETTHRFSTHWVEISGPVICCLNDVVLAIRGYQTYRGIH